MLRSTVRTTSLQRLDEVFRRKMIAAGLAEFQEVSGWLMERISKNKKRRCNASEIQRRSLRQREWF